MSGPVLSCPLPHGISETVQLAHGGGGRAMNQLIDQVFRPAFDNPWLQQAHDGAVFELNGHTAMSTDSYVISPLFFPGGDIGKLAVYGTVNDLVMCGAKPEFLSAGFILEEGLQMATLIQIVNSMADAARETGVKIVTGDIKVVDRGKADRMYVNTAGVGQVISSPAPGPHRVKPDDAIILSGDIGRHGVAVMAAREDLKLETQISSDSASLVAPVMDLIEAGIVLHCLRDLTRGGLASALVEISETSGLPLEIQETAIPLRKDVEAVCELLGLDPLHVANEGRFIAFVSSEDAGKAIEILKQYEACANAAVIGYAAGAQSARVTMQGRLGTMRAIDMLSGNQLPRIC